MASNTDLDAQIEKIKADFNDAVLGLDGEGSWEELVETIADFGAQYSFANQLLILMQAAQRGLRPSMVMSKGNWSKKDRELNPGAEENPLYVWAACSYAISKDEIARRQAAGRVAFDGNGKPVKALRGFRLEPTFDITQTNGADVELPPSIVRKWRVYQGPEAELLTGDDTGDALSLVVREIEKLGYTFVLVDPKELGRANGDTNPTAMRVRVRNDVSPLQTLKTSVHEWAHIVSGHTENMAEYSQHRGRMECEAESIAHIVLKVLGMDTGAYSMPYVAGWSKGNAKILKAAGKKVIEGSRTIIKALNPPAEKTEQKSQAKAVEVAA